MSFAPDDGFAERPERTKRPSGTHKRQAQRSVTIILNENSELQLSGQRLNSVPRVQYQPAQCSTRVPTIPMTSKVRFAPRWAAIRRLGGSNRRWRQHHPQGLHAGPASRPCREERRCRPIASTSGHCSHFGKPSRAEAARQTGMDRPTLRDWVHRFNDAGVDVRLAAASCRVFCGARDVAARRPSHGAVGRVPGRFRGKRVGSAAAPREGMPEAP
jgi:hypothetical protein